MNKLRNASLLFAATLMGWGLFAILSISYTVYIITRLSMSFFQANGLISNPEIIEAIYYQVFSVEAVFFFMLLLGFSGVGIMAFIFSNSQFNYFKRLGDSLVTYSLSNTTPSFKNLGPFGKHAHDFVDVVNLRIEKKGEESIREKLQAAAKLWPAKPMVSWFDQLQFGIIAVLIAGFFAMLSLIFFWKITDRLVELSGHLIRYKVATGPMFFNAQTEIITFVMWTVFTFMGVAFAITGFRFGNRVSEASYAVLRDLRRFMQGDFKHRVALRNDDPAQVLLPHINEALDRIEAKIKS